MYINYSRIRIRDLSPDQSAQDSICPFPFVKIFLTRQLTHRHLLTPPSRFTLMSQEFRGTSQAQDSRFANKEQSLLRSTKFPPNFSTRVDVSKCDLKVIRTWVEHQILKILGVDDEVVTEYLMEALEGERVRCGSVEGHMNT